MFADNEDLYIVGSRKRQGLGDEIKKEEPAGPEISTREAAR